MERDNNKMIPRRDPLCVPHFLEFAEENLVEYFPICMSPAVRNGERRRAKAESSAPIRIQPRRAAKDRRPRSYADTPPRKRRRSAADTAADISNTTKLKCRRSMDDLQSKVDVVVEQILAEKERDCPYGFKPWVCRRCEENVVAISRVGTMWLATRTCGTPEGSMEPDRGVSLLLDWEGMLMPQERVFHWGGKEFAVDTCDKTMVLML